MTWLKRRSPALRANSNQNVFQINDRNNLIAWERSVDPYYLVIVANFSNTNWGGYWIGLPRGGTWHEVINSNAAKYDGTGEFQNSTFTAFDGPSNGMPYSAPVNLPARSIVVFGHHSEDPNFQYDLTPDLDADNDGIEDAWELANALDPNQRADATEDYDFDGKRNVLEFLLGTNPQAHSRDALPAVAAVPQGMEIRFSSIPNRSYQVWYSDDLQTWNPLDAALSTRGDVNASEIHLIDTELPPQGQRFYRVEIENVR